MSLLRRKRMSGELHRLADLARAALAARYFKTAPGEYAAGDHFLGLSVPAIRRVCRAYRDLSLPDLRKLLRSPYHEERFAALVLLTYKFSRVGVKTQAQIYKLYLASTRWINNWDLVDVSAPRIVGEYLLGKPKTELRTLAASPLLWDRRIAIIATLESIRHGDAAPCLEIAARLLHDKHDLIHKAVGWMLREVGKLCSLEIEERFLRQHAARMPRTMLRYAIERFPESKRREYLALKRPPKAA